MERDKRWRLFLITVGFTLLACFTPLQITASHPDEIVVRSLEVPLFAQQTNQWCWAASGEMIMSYLGRKVSQCNQVKDIKDVFPGLNNCCQNYNNCRVTWWPRFQLYEFPFKATRYGKALSWQELVEQIDNNKPVGFSWKWSSGSKGIKGHYMVAKGYIILGDVKLVVVNDPAPWSEDKKRGGSVKIISYRDYVSFPPRYTHWFDHYYDLSKEKGDVKTSVTPPAANTLQMWQTKQRVQRVQRVQREEEEKAARELLQLLKQLPLSILEELGFTSRQMVNQCSLGNRLETKTIGLNRLELFDINVGFEEITEDINEINYPVYWGEELISCITIRKRGGKWRFAVLGGKEILSVERARRKYADSRLMPHSSCFMVQIPDLQLTFLGCYSDNWWYLIPTHQHPDPGIPLFEPMLAKELLIQLKFSIDDPVEIGKSSDSLYPGSHPHLQEGHQPNK